MISRNFISETIFSFNLTDIFFSILKGVNAPLEIVPRSVSSRPIPHFAGLTATGISNGVNQILSEWDKNTTKIIEDERRERRS